MSRTEREKREAKFYKALRDLECSLQELGVRPDFGVPTEPNFAAETLFSALEYTSGLQGADLDFFLVSGTGFVRFAQGKIEKAKQESPSVYFVDAETARSLLQSEARGEGGMTNFLKRLAAQEKNTLAGKTPSA